MTDTTKPARPTTAAPLALRITAGLSVLAASWLAMMAVHELGHVLAAWNVGGSVHRVDLPWLGFSRTDVAPNPRPLYVAWAGPAAGVVLPVLGWVAARQAYPPAQALLRFFAGWCLVCNGTYLGLGWINRVGDAGDLLQHGAALWQLIAFGALSFALGLWLWHGLGRGMGMSGATRTSCRRLLATALIVGLLYGVGGIAIS